MLRKVSSLSSHILSRSSSLPPSFYPRYSQWAGYGGERKERKRKKIKGNARCSAVNALHVGVIGSSNGVVAEIAEIFFGINRSKILSPLRDPPMARNSLCLFINSRDEVVCAHGSLHILWISGGRAREKGREKKKKREIRDLVSANTNGNPLFVHANRRRIRFNGKNSSDEQLSPLREIIDVFTNWKPMSSLNSQKYRD